MFTHNGQLTAQLVQCWSSSRAVHCRASPAHSKGLCGGHKCLPHFFVGMPLGKDPLVSRFLCGTLRLRPVARNRVPTWDLAIVLQGLSLAPVEPLEDVPAKFLTLKALFLLAISSLMRIGDLQALSVAPLCLEFAPGMVKAFLHPRPCYVPKVMWRVLLCCKPSVLLLFRMWTRKGTICFAQCGH